MAWSKAYIFYAIEEAYFWDSIDICKIISWSSCVIMKLSKYLYPNIELKYLDMLTNIALLFNLK